MDNHSAFEVKIDNIDFLEKELVLKSKLVLASSNFLVKKIEKYHPQKLILIKNAGDFNHFSKAISNNYAIPKELRNLKKPIIGYYGAICEWFDTKILEKLAINYPIASIVLIGNVDNQKVTELSKKYNNIFLLGEKSYETLPAYLQEFDVCLIPFIINELIKATDPVKIYEYFAAGKPVVATEIPDLKEFKEFLYLSTTIDDFCENVERALTEKDSQLKIKRQEIAKNNTWGKRGEQLNSLIREQIF